MVPKASVRRSVEVPPCWHVVSAGVAPAEGRISVVLGPGAGFGDGAHETTAVCLQALAAFAPRGGSSWRMLDFGAGSGILAIGAAKLGASVDAIEIDLAAMQSARANARRNSVEDRIRLGRTLDEAVGRFDLVVANIVRAVLLEHSAALGAKLLERGTLVLSGLVATDVPEVIACYAPLLGGRRPDIYERGEWRALVWRPESG